MNAWVKNRGFAVVLLFKTQLWYGVYMRRRILIFIGILVVAGLAIASYILLPQIFGEVTYPLAYDNLIIQYSKDRQLDPYLVAAVIYSESHFHPTAVSPVGARGLMQLMPATATGIAKKIGLTNFKINDLFDPETNISIGTYNLQGLAGRYNSNIDGMLAAYNGGGAVGDRYVAGQGGIPTETQRYVVNVKAAMQKYKDLYSDRLNPKVVTPASVTTSQTSPALNSLSSHIITLFVSSITKP